MPAMASGTNGDTAASWRTTVAGVEVLHAHFRRYDYPRHAHEAATVALMDTGGARFWYRGGTHTVGAGGGFLLDPGAVHTGVRDHPDGYSYRVLYLSPHVLAGEGESGPGPGWSFGPTVIGDRAADRTLTALLHRTHRALAGPASPLVREELVLRCGALLRRRYAAPPAAEPAGGGPNRAVTVVRDFLEAHPTDDVSLRDLAGLALVSPYRLVRLFTAAVGMPPHAYQIQLRVRVARALLAGGLPAGTVAARAGFFDQAHLTRVFKKYTGMTPGQFARNKP